jgi:hypothetical protein
MTLDNHKTTFISWVKSCKTSEQIDLLRSIIDTFFVKRFIDKGDKLDMVFALDEINEAIRDQMKMVVIIETNINEIPTLAYQTQL